MGLFSTHALWRNLAFESNSVIIMGLSALILTLAIQTSSFYTPTASTIFWSTFAIVITFKMWGLFTSNSCAKSGFLQCQWSLRHAVLFGCSSFFTYKCFKAKSQCMTSIQPSRDSPTIQGWKHQRTIIKLSCASCASKDFWRCWRGLAGDMLKRAGRGHDECGVQGTRPGELAVICPACPHPGINLPEGWEDAPVEQRYKVLHVFLYQILMPTQISLHPLCCSWCML